MTSAHDHHTPPSLREQATALRGLGLLADEALPDLDGHPPGALLITSAPASSLAPLIAHGDKPGFIVEDLLADVDRFSPTEHAPVPDAPYVVSGLDRGDEWLHHTPEEALPQIIGAGRSPLTLTEGLHWVLQVPSVLERNHCFMTIGSRLRKPNGSFDARTPALWISNGTGRDGRDRRNAPKVGWCWWRNRHTWLGIASCAARAR